MEEYQKYILALATSLSIFTTVGIMGYRGIRNKLRASKERKLAEIRRGAYELGRQEGFKQGYQKGINDTCSVGLPKLSSRQKEGELTDITNGRR
jgi:hypothetical protein